jgi:hypothetical protein
MIVSAHWRVFLLHLVSEIAQTVGFDAAYRKPAKRGFRVASKESCPTILTECEPPAPDSDL